MFSWLTNAWRVPELRRRVLFTAADAYVRNYEIVIPRDCVAAIKPGNNELALEYFRTVLKADVRSSVRIDLKHTGRRGRPPGT